MVVKASATVTIVRYRDTESLTRCYRLQASSAAKPPKPTARPPAGWTATEPAYTAGATNSLYTCELTLFSDGSWAYSDVSLSSSYEAAKLAYNEAKAAQDAAGDALGRTLYGACNTAAATAAKAPASTIAGFKLAAGASVRIKFTYANTAAAPTLNVNGTGAKQIRLNGANSAYWAAGATVDLVYDGTCWQVCSTPLYGATATIGSPAGGNVYVDGSGVSVRDGSAALARFAANELVLAANAGMGSDAVVRLADAATLRCSWLSPSRRSLSIGSDNVHVQAAMYGQVQQASLGIGGKGVRVEHDGNGNVSTDVNTGLSINGSPVADWAVGSGRTGAWEWARLASGRAWARGSVDVAVACNDAWGCVYQSPLQVAPAYPAGLFAARPACLTLLEGESSGSYMDGAWITVSHRGTKDKPGDYYLNMPRATGSYVAGGTVVFDAVGRWR